MNEKLLITLLNVSSFMLTIAGGIFLALQIFGNNKNNTYLIIAFVLILLANLFNVIIKQHKKEIEATD